MCPRGRVVEPCGAAHVMKWKQRTVNTGCTYEHKGTTLQVPRCGLKRTAVSKNTRLRQRRWSQEDESPQRGRGFGRESPEERKNKYTETEVAGGRRRERNERDGKRTSAGWWRRCACVCVA